MSIILRPTNTFFEGLPQINPSAPENRGLLFALPGVGDRPTWDPVNRIDGTLHGTTTIPDVMPGLGVLALDNNKDASGDGLTTAQGGVYTDAARLMDNGEKSFQCRFLANTTISGVELLTGFRKSGAGFLVYINSGVLTVLNLVVGGSVTFAHTFQQDKLYDLSITYNSPNWNAWLNGVKLTPSGTQTEYPYAVTNVRFGLGCWWDESTPESTFGGFVVDGRWYARELTALECLEYHNPATAYRLYEQAAPIFIEAVAGGSVDNLLADNISVTPTLSSPALAQGQVLLADNISVTPTLSSPVLTEDGTDNLLADDISVTPTLSSPALAQGQVLLADDISVTPTLSSPVLADFVPSTYTITTLLFRPDFNWTKIRNTTARSHILTDALNGVGNILKSDSTAALTAASQTVLAFNSDGVSYGSDNQVTDTGKNFISHNWYMAATTDAGNADGDISADIRANITAGQSVVTYTADGVGSTVGHGLDEAPQLILIKKTSGGVQNWKVYSETMGPTYAGYLNLAANFSTGDADRITAVGVDNFTVGGTFAVDTNEVTAYCFHSVPGYSKVDSYTGNGNADGPYIDLGFRPAFLMIKNTAQGSTNWSMFDNQRPGYNDSGFNIFANLPNVEPVALDQLIDFTSRGFKLRNSATSVNSNTVTHTYIAFAESPGNYSRAR